MLGLDKLIDALRLPTRTLAAVALVAAILIFSSPQFLESLGLATFVGEYRPYIGVVFLVASCLVGMAVVAGGWRFYRPWLLQYWHIHYGKKRMKSLTPDEKVILRYYLNNNTRSQKLDIKSGIVHALEREMIIIRAANLGDFYGFDYNIQPWAWEYLKRNPDVLD